MKRKGIMFLILGMLTIVLTSSAALRAAAEDNTEATVWTMTNDPAGNAVLAFRLANGQLTPLGSVSTGGTGSGGREPDFGLGNAHALQLNADGTMMFAANAGSNDISVFAVSDNALTLLDRVPSGGQQPLSITAHGNLVYVLNGGGNVGGVDNIAGFRLGSGGKLTPISNSSRPLSAAATAPAQIQFTPDGSVLVVTEKNTSVIDTFTVGSDGRASGPNVTQGDAETPFGFDIANGDQLFVSDDFNDAPGAGAMSSWIIGDNGNLRLVSSVVPANQSGACWIVVHPSGRFAFMADTVSSRTSTFAINEEDGSVSLVTSFPSPTLASELALSHDGGFLFALAPDENLQASPGLIAWSVNPNDGSVTLLSVVNGLPRSIDGLVAR